jgi:hypothetical protein
MIDHPRSKDLAAIFFFQFGGVLVDFLSIPIRIIREHKHQSGMV